MNGKSWEFLTERQWTLRAKRLLESLRNARLVFEFVSNKSVFRACLICGDGGGPDTPEECRGRIIELGTFPYLLGKLRPDLLDAWKKMFWGVESDFVWLSGGDRLGPLTRTGGHGLVERIEELQEELDSANETIHRLLDERESREPGLKFKGGYPDIPF